MNRGGMIAGVIAGVIIGYNWPKIRRVTAPVVSTAREAVSGVVITGMRGVVQVKENIEDHMAERKAQRDMGEVDASA